MTLIDYKFNDKTHISSNYRNYISEIFEEKKTLKD